MRRTLRLSVSMLMISLRSSPSTCTPAAASEAACAACARVRQAITITLTAHLEATPKHAVAARKHTVHSTDSCVAGERRGVFGSSGPTFCIFDAICSAVIPFRNMPQSAADSARTSAPAASSARVCGAGAGERKVSRRASEAALAGCARCAGVQSAECSHLGDAAALGAVHQRVPAPQVLADRDARHSLHRRHLSSV